MSFIFIFFLISRSFPHISLDVPQYMEERKNLYGGSKDFLTTSKDMEISGAIEDNGKLFFILKNGEIYEYYNKKFTGFIKLKEEIVTAPKIYNNVLYIATASGKLIAIKNNGEILWSKTLFSAPIISPPVPYEEFLILKSPYDDLLLIDSRSGETKRYLKYEGRSPDYMVFSLSSPVIHEGMVFYGTQRGEIIKANPDFQLVWKINLKEGIFSNAEIQSVTGNSLVTILQGRYLITVDTENGKKLWEKEAEKIVEVAPLKGNLLLVTQDGRFLVLAPETGKELGKKGFRKIKDVTAVSTSGDGKIAVGTGSGHLYILDENLRILQEIKLEGGIPGITLYSRGIAVLTDAGNAYVFRGK